MWKLVNSGGVVKQKFISRKRCVTRKEEVLFSLRQSRFGGSFRPFTQQIFFPRANNPSASLVNNKLVDTTLRRLEKSQSTDGIRYLD